jgi:hypothetical protein
MSALIVPESLERVHEALGFGVAPAVHEQHVDRVREARPGLRGTLTCSHRRRAHLAHAGRGSPRRSTRAGAGDLTVAVAPLEAATAPAISNGVLRRIRGPLTGQGEADPRHDHQRDHGRQDGIATP